MSPWSVRSNTLSPGSPAWGGPVRTSWRPIEKGCGWSLTGGAMLAYSPPSRRDPRSRSNPAVGGKEVTQNPLAHRVQTPLQVQESEDNTRIVATLVLCQPGSQGTLLACSSCRRWGSPLSLGRSTYQSVSLLVVGI